MVRYKSKKAISSRQNKKNIKINKIQGFKSRFFEYLKILILRYPERSFFGLLIVLAGVIIIGSYLRKPPVKSEETIKPVKNVQLFSIGSAPKITMIGKVEKSGVIKLVAQSAGIVQKLYVKEGQSINRGSSIAWISTNPQGGTIPTATRQIAQKNAEFVESNYGKQKEMINKRRDLADKLDGQNDKLREIAGASISDTKGLITLNEDILSSLDSQLSALEATNVDHSNDALILQVKQGKSGVQSGLLSLKSALRNAEFQSDGSHEPGRMSDLTKELTMKQLEIEEKSLELNREISKLNLTVAQIGESLMYPVSPIAGIVERTYVQAGSAISPGTVIASITGNTTSGIIIVSVPKEIANKVSRIEKSTIRINGKTGDAFPTYISKEPTEGQFHSVQFLLPPEFLEEVGNGGSVQVDLTFGASDSSAVFPQIPLDALYQTKTDSYVFVATESSGELITATKKIVTGPVFGSYVEITKGLGSGDRIIVDRGVIEGDRIKGE